MTRFEFYSRKQEWRGDNHFRAWRDRMEIVAPQFTAKDGIFVVYSFLAIDESAAETMARTIFEETKFAVLQKGPHELKFS